MKKYLKKLRRGRHIKIVIARSAKTIGRFVPSVVMGKEEKCYT